MLQIDSRSQLALGIDDVCALDETRLSNATRFREFASGLEVTPTLLTQLRWQSTGFGAGPSAAFEIIMHEMLPEAYDVNVLESKGPFGVRITGVGDFTVTAINLRVLVFKGLPLDMMTNKEVVDIEIAPDVFMAFCRGQILAVSEDILEEDDEFEDRTVSDFELEMAGIPAGGLTKEQYLDLAKRNVIEVVKNLTDMGSAGADEYKQRDYYAAAKNNVIGWAENAKEASKLGIDIDEKTLDLVNKILSRTQEGDQIITDIMQQTREAGNKLPNIDMEPPSPKGDCSSNTKTGDGCAANNTSCNTNLGSGACAANATFCSTNLGLHNACAANGTACGLNLATATACAANVGACGVNGSMDSACGTNVGACGAKANIDSVCASNQGACGANAALATACAVNVGGCAANACVANACVINVGGGDVFSACLINIIPGLPSC